MYAYVAAEAPLFVRPMGQAAVSANLMSDADIIFILVCLICQKMTCICTGAVEVAGFLFRRPFSIILFFQIQSVAFFSIKKIIFL